jgi:hypothetical protein
MSRTIILNEKNVKAIIDKSIRTTLVERFKRALSESSTTDDSNNGLPQSFTNALYELEDMKASLQGFIAEYSILTDKINTLSKKFGLVLDNFNQDGDFNISEAVDGRTYDFEYFLVIPNIDVDSMSEQEYSEIDRKLDMIYDEFANELGKTQYGSIRLYKEDNGITIFYAFSLGK